MMCGLFGYFGPLGPETGLLSQIAALAAKRGPDGWGVVTDVASEYGLGRLQPNMARGIEANFYAIGHCRLATVPGTKTIRACQPLRIGRYVLAHNGTVGNLGDLQDAFGIRLTTGNDSEAIGQLMRLLPGSTNERLDAALDTIDHGGHYAVTVLDTELGTMHLRANCMPLYTRKQDEGFYWCSIKPDDLWELHRG